MAPDRTSVTGQVASRPSVRAMAPPSLLATIAAGGCVGALARYGVLRLLPPTPQHFPWATWLVNVTGSVCLGLVLGAVTIGAHVHPRRRALVATGVIGAFTTFSTWAVDVDHLLAHGRAGLAIVDVVASVGAGVLALMAGARIVRVRHMHHRRVAETAP